MTRPDDHVAEAPRDVDVLVVGAGVSGLAAASELQAAGREVLVVDKGRGVGGRLASRRIGGATFDQGAQFMTARTPRFAAVVEQWIAEGVAKQWYRSADGEHGGHSRWRGMPTMTGLAKRLARDVEVRLRTPIASLCRTPEGWRAELEGAAPISARAVVLTPPVPQSLALLASGGWTVPTEELAGLEGIEYERCLAVMVVLDRPARIPPPGGLAPTQGPIAWIADNQAKGVSAAPAVTIHATADFSAEHWTQPRNDVGWKLIQAANPWLGSRALQFEIHGWRYSKPVRIDERTCVVLSKSPPLVLAGDAFAGPRVEGAALSGWAAAEALARLQLDVR